jgi:1-acyl-sn-glycerol-3-phosphate acyltransferase
LKKSGFPHLRLLSFLRTGYNKYQMHWVYYFGRVVIHLVVLPFASWEIKGRENIPGRGPFLIVCNHLHIADPPMVAASLPLKSVIMAKEELWNNSWSRFWVENFGAFPVNRGGLTREALRRGEAWLKKGVSLVMFPEGGRSKGAAMEPALPGAALIAERAGVPILPVSITGTEKFKNIGWCFLHRPKATVTIGKPFSMSPPGEGLAKDRRQALMNEIMRKIAELLPPEYRGVYGGGENA